MKRPFLLVVPLAALAMVASAQSSTHSLRFHGTGLDQQDRARFRVDDNAAGPDASTGADIGNGPFTIEFWIKGTLPENASAGRPAGSYADYDWILGNVVIDRDLDSPVERDFGISVRGGRVEFGTGRGNGPGADSQSNTLVGATNVLDGQWRHVAAVREASGAKRLYLDGVLDGSAPAGTSLADLSFPDAGVAGMPVHCSAQSWGNYIVLGAEKHDYDQFEEGCAPAPLANAEYPSFNGWIDEVRLWRTARAQADIASARAQVLVPPFPTGLGAYWRFEEGAGSVLEDSVPGNPPGELVAGIPGNGEWSTDVPFPGSARVGEWKELGH